MHLPFIGRLCLSEYLALVSSFFLVGLELIIRILTLALPSTIIKLCYRASRRAFNRFTSAATKRSETRKQGWSSPQIECEQGVKLTNSDISTSIRNASDFVDLCEIAGYYAEEHVVQTGDGYLLCVHRLAWKKGEENTKVNSGPDSIKKPVVYLHHGLLMNSEVWVCLTDKERCLPFTLVERGYDVWLGNNRGNKYSKKSIHHSPTDAAFWNFSMDEFAFHDIPDTIQYILDTTSAPSLSYIGFSQGTAQAFATLAVHPKLNDQINVFIALAPAMSPAGLSNGIVDALIKASPQVLFLLFGRRSILSSTTMWQSILYPPIFVRLIDMSLSFLFGWKAKNISLSQKLAAYTHLYSFTSTKSVVHWFQIIRTKSFQMYDDEPQPVLGGVDKYTKVAKFPTRNIKTPIVLVYGGSDSLVDINVMLKELPAHTTAIEISHYEHLDFLWAREVETLVFPHVFDALESFYNAEHSKEEYELYNRARTNSMRISTSNNRVLTYLSEEDSGTQSLGSETYVDADPNVILQPGDESSADLKITDGTYNHNSARKRVKLGSQTSYINEDDSSETSPIGANASNPFQQLDGPRRALKPKPQLRPEGAQGVPSTPPSHSHPASSNSCIPVTTPSPQPRSQTQTPTPLRKSLRSSSIGSNISFEIKGNKSRPGSIGGSGISLGVGRAVGGVVSGLGEGIRGKEDVYVSDGARSQGDSSASANDTGKENGKESGSGSMRVFGGALRRKSGKKGDGPRRALKPKPQLRPEGAQGVPSTPPSHSHPASSNSCIPVTTPSPQPRSQTQTPTPLRKSLRSSSIGSNISFEIKGNKSRPGSIGGSGISLGVGRAVGGVVSGLGEGIRGKEDVYVSDGARSQGDSSASANDTGKENGKESGSGSMRVFGGALRRKSGKKGGW
ncbi:cholesterol esterase [Ciborinia camelliae]|nr:cholesterol esterase [Ciborinia camelliae]